LGPIVAVLGWAPEAAIEALEAGPKGAEEELKAEERSDAVVDPNPLQTYMHRVAEVVEDIEDVVSEAEEEGVVAKVDEEGRERRIETAHTAEWTTIPPKTAGSVKGIIQQQHQRSHKRARYAGDGNEL